MVVVTALVVELLAAGTTVVVLDRAVLVEIVVELPTIG